MALKPTHYEIIFGSNTYRDVSGILLCKGKELLKVERGATDLQLLVSTEVRDQAGNLIAKIHHNATSYVAQGFEASGDAKTVRILNKQTLETVFEASILGPSKLEVNGHFWIEGVFIRARKDGMQVGGNVIASGTFEGGGTGVAIT